MTALVQSLVTRAANALGVQRVERSHAPLLGLAPPAHQPQPAIRGSQNLINTYNTDPHMHMVTDRIGTTILSVSRGWQLFHSADMRRASVASMQRAASFARERMIFRRKNNGTLVEVTDNPLLDMLATVNFKVVELHLDIVGESFVALERNGIGGPVRGWVVPPHWIRDVPSPTRDTFEVSWRGWETAIGAHDMVWFKSPDPVDPYARGAAPAKALADELETDQYLSSFQRAFFLNSARPDMLVFPKSQGPQDTGLGKGEVERLEEGWISKHLGFMRSFKPMFVGREVGIHELRHDLSGLDVSDMRKHVRDIVTQVYGVPPEVLGVIENSNRATVMAADFLYQKNVIVPRMELLRSHLQAQLVPQFDDRLVLSYVSPVDEDSAFHLEVARAAPHSLTIDEWRSLQGKDPLPNGAGAVFAISNKMKVVEHLLDATDGKGRGFDQV